MILRFFIIFTVFVGLFSPVVVRATDDSVRESEEESIEEKDDDEDNEDSAEEKAQERFIKAKAEALKKRLEVKAELETKKQEAIREREAKKEEFRLKLQEIKDERKQKVVENLSERFGALNTKWTEHWNSVLDRLAQILVKILSRADALADTGKDVSSVRTAVTAAEAAIASAQSAVTAQAGATYSIEIKSEETLGENTSGEINSFHEDLRKTYDLVQKAREAVVGALRALKSVGGVNGN